MRPLPDLTREELTRYARHVILPDVGIDGQRRLKAARVVCVGAGGLGSPAAMYLAAAGVGTLGIVDFDVVDASNLQRQILHDTAGMGRPKVESAKARLKAINPNVSVELHHVRLTSANALDILGRYDVVLDGADNFPTRYLVNDACVLLGKPNAFGAIFRFEGQASVFAAKNGPCYRCIYPEPPPPGLVPSCAEAGVFGVLPGVIGTIQATETIKLILGAGETLVGRLLVYDAMRMTFHELKVPKDPECPVCGKHPTVRELIDYEAFCGMKQMEEPPSEPASTTDDRGREPGHHRRRAEGAMGPRRPPVPAGRAGGRRAPARQTGRRRAHSAGRTGRPASRSWTPTSRSSSTATTATGAAGPPPTCATTASRTPATCAAASRSGR